LKTTVIAVVGSKSSGKTTTIEILTKELTNRGYNVAVIKHIPEPNFTIDTEGKDTWRFAKSGARTIISVASNEIATIEKVNSGSLSLDEILQKCKDHDVVFVEGFRKSVGKNEEIHKVVIVKSAEEALEAVKNFEPILAFVGPYPAENLDVKIPYVDALKNPERIADIVENAIIKRR
jgi:molybdopterin-guanine dinucleotide biosynthesis protein MobB